MRNLKRIVVFIFICLIIYLKPFILSGIKVDIEMNSGPPIVVINKNDRPKVYHGKSEINNSLLYPLKPLRTENTLFKSDEYLLIGSICGLRKGDDSSFYYVYDITGLLPLNLYYVLVGFLILLGFLIIYTVKIY